MSTTVKEVIQAITDPENQPSQFGTVRLSTLQRLAALARSCEAQAKTDEAEQFCERIADAIEAAMDPSSPAPADERPNQLMPSGDSVRVQRCYRCLAISSQSYCSDECRAANMGSSRPQTLGEEGLEIPDGWEVRRSFDLDSSLPQETPDWVKTHIENARALMNDVALLESSGIHTVVWLADDRARLVEALEETTRDRDEARQRMYDAQNECRYHECDAEAAREALEQKEKDLQWAAAANKGYGDSQLALGAVLCGDSVESVLPGRTLDDYPLAQKVAALQSTASRQQEEGAELRRAGTQLANAAYNLAQRDHLTEQERTSLRQCYERWDKASQSPSAGA